MITESNQKQFDKLIAKIEEGYTVHRGPKWKQKTSFSPSTLVYGSGACPRYWFHAFSGATFDDDVSAQSVASMEAGTAGHERLQAAMKNAGILIDDEVRVISNDPPIFGFADGIISWNKEELPVEIKTMKEESFQYRKHKNQPPPYHLEQLIIYMKILKKAKGLLIYESKNSHELHVIQVDVSDEYREWVDNAFDWMKLVYGAWENNTLPKRPYRKNSKVCKECPVNRVCYESDEGVVELPRLVHLK